MLQPLITWNTYYIHSRTDCSETRKGRAVKKHIQMRLKRYETSLTSLSSQDQWSWSNQPRITHHQELVNHYRTKKGPQGTETRNRGTKVQFLSSCCPKSFCGRGGRFQERQLSSNLVLEVLRLGEGRSGVDGRKVDSVGSKDQLLRVEVCILC